MKPQLLIVIILITFLATCKPKEDEPSNFPYIKFTISQPNQLPADLVVYEAATNIYGEWFSIDPGNSVKLTFNPDGTFYYVSQSDSIDSVHGNWTINGSNYILNGQLKSRKNGDRLSKDDLPLFKKAFRFTRGFVYEVYENDSLSSYYFVQLKTTANSEFGEMPASE